MQRSTRRSTSCASSVGRSLQRPAAEAAVDGDRVTIDFEGKIDGVPFEGGKAEGFQFILGEGQMLEQFEKAVRGMKTGESKTFPLHFPADYHGKDVAGKEADFIVTLKKIEAQHLPDVDEAFAKALGIADGTVEALRADINKNLEREVKFRVLARNKASVMDALVKAAELDVPKALVQARSSAWSNRLEPTSRSAASRTPKRRRSRPNCSSRKPSAACASDSSWPNSSQSNNLQAKPDQIKAHIDELAQSYEKPDEVVRWYLGDQKRIAEVEAMVLENNVTEYVLSRAKVNDKSLAFDELMAA